MIQPQPRGYMPELDGLRAVALAGVLLVHLYLPGFSLGWAGVNLFFVISGFLITGILLDSKAHPHFFRNFYARRSLRIFPIYYLTLLVIFVGALALRQDVSDVLFFVFYTQNYLLALKDFDTDFPLLFNHTWSLAIEEQFYLLWPLVVFWLGPRSLLRVVIAMFVAAALCRLLIFVFLGGHYLLYTSLPVQLDGLAAGALLELLVRLGVPREWLARWSLLLVAVCAAGIGLLVYNSGLEAFWDAAIWTARPANILLFSLLALFFLGLLASTLWGNTPLSALLRTRPLIHIGQISYGLYLYHFPVFRLLSELPTANLGQRIWLICAKLLLTYAIALVSWHLVERPCNRLKRHFSTAS